MTPMYLCDRRACKKCDPSCRYTSDISHAKNFEKTGDIYSEKEHPVVIFHTPMMLKEETQMRIRDGLKKQMEEGLVFCDGVCKPITVTDDAIIYKVLVTTEYPSYFWVCPTCGANNGPGEQCIVCGNSHYTIANMWPITQKQEGKSSAVKDKLNNIFGKGAKE